MSCGSVIGLASFNGALWLDNINIQQTINSFETRGLPAMAIEAMSRTSRCVNSISLTCSEIEERIARYVVVRK